MSRRLEIELTSQRDDGTWTWRAAGARQPKGVVSSALVPEAAAVGTVLRAEADGGLDGLEITALSAPRTRAESTDRLELIGHGSEPLVTTKLVSKSRRDGRGPDGRGDQRPRGRDRGKSRDDDRRGDRRQGRRDEHRDEENRGRRDRKPRRSDGSTGERPRGEDARRDFRSGSGRDRRPERSDRRTDRGDDKRSPRSQRAKDGARAERPPRPRTPGLKAKRIHRRAALAALPEDQRHLAREVLRGGVPGARKTIEQMNAKAVAAHLPQIKSEPILVLAEQLAPMLKAAEWHDRADAALAGISKIDLRDIRSVIAAAERAARTDETRAMAESLRAGLAQRLEVDHRKWMDELASTIGEGRTIRALRLSSRPPKAGTPLPPDMAERLANLAAEALNPTANQQRWSTVVDSVALSPVRTQVIPVGAPEKPSEDLLTTVRRLADRVPQIASIFGIEPQASRRRPRRPPPPPATPPASNETEQQQEQAPQAQQPDEQEDAPQAQQPDEQQEDAPQAQQPDEQEDAPQAQQPDEQEDAPQPPQPDDQQEDAQQPDEEEDAS